MTPARPAGDAGPAPSSSSATTEPLQQWALDHLTRSHDPGGRGIEDICEVDLHPVADLVACTVRLREDPMARARRAVLVVDLSGERVSTVEVPYPEASTPAWSPDGGRLAVVGSVGDGADAVVLAGAPHDLQVLATTRLAGVVEAVAWSPDGTRLALRVAMPGAELSDVHGSGVVGGARAESWRPHVYPGEAGGRAAYVWEPGPGDPRRVSGPTVWELAWNGDHALLALTSDGAGEGAWYAADLTRIDLETGRYATLLRPEHQLSLPRSEPGGSRWSVLSGVQSDRGLPSGTVLCGGPGPEPPTALGTAGVHVTDHRWLDPDTVLVAGLRGLDTVVATVEPASGRVTELWSGEATCGELQPEVAGRAGRAPVVVLEDHRTPPVLGSLTTEGFRPALAVDGPGADHVVAHAGTLTRVSWRSSDGLEIQGLLALPEQSSTAPHALVVEVHGGPTHAARATWSGRAPHAACLLARGYAVLRPNVRGSTGRGPDFAAAVQGDMGGLDVDDVVTGVRHLVDRGVADPARLGILGISYGGFLAAWVPTRTDLFAASVARSPCTDWLLQHLTSNIAEFDRRFLVGDPFDPASQYGTRSPLRHVDRVHTPLLLTAGLEDLATPPSQAQVLHNALRERGVETRLVLYPGEGHGVREPRTLADECARVVGWFEEHMAPGR